MLSEVADVGDEVILLLLLLSNRGLFTAVEILSSVDDFIMEFSPLLLLVIGLANDLSFMFFAIIISLVVVGV